MILAGSHSVWNKTQPVIWTHLTLALDGGRKSQRPPSYHGAVSPRICAEIDHQISVSEKSEAATGRHLLSSSPTRAGLEASSAARLVRGPAP